MTHPAEDAAINDVRAIEVVRQHGGEADEEAAFTTERLGFAIELPRAGDGGGSAWVAFTTNPAARAAFGYIGMCVDARDAYQSIMAAEAAEV